MTAPICEDEGLLQEWAPESRLLNKIPAKAQKGIFAQDLKLTCIDAVSDFIALGTNCGFVYWYCRDSGELKRLRLEVSITGSPCTCTYYWWADLACHGTYFIAIITARF